MLSVPTVVRLGFMGLAAALLASGAVAQDYPSRPVKMIVPFPAGGASDVVARIVADKLGELLGPRMVIENKGGAGGNIGTNQGAKSDPDGYTILFSTSGPLAVNQSLFKSLPYDVEADLQPISLVATLPNVLVVNPKAIPVTTVKDFIAYAKERPGKINYSSIGMGSSQHLAGVLFERATGTQLKHIPYRVAGQFVIDMLSGEVPASFQLIPNVQAQLISGEIRPIAVMADTRSLALPNVPTMAEQGVPNLISFAWFGLLAPKKTPQPIIDRLVRDTRKAMQDDGVRKRLIEIGAEPASSSPDEFAKLIRDETVKWREIVKAANVTLE